MLKLRAEIQIYVRVTPIDMRKSIDGLSALVSQEFNGDPLSGHLFVFFNRSRDKVKLIYWDRNGYVLHYKRMEKHRFYAANFEQTVCLADLLQLGFLK